MKKSDPYSRAALAKRGARSALFTVAAVLTAVSAIHAKTGRLPVAPLAAIESHQSTTTSRADRIINQIAPTLTTEVKRPADVRYFNGRPVRPVRTVWITVTAYSPDHRSCGEHADGITASNKSVWTNAMKLVAADTSILPIGTMLTIPGYDGDRIVPVLDRGGAIKGARLDVLFPSHDEALEWGVQRLPVTIWEYAD